MVVALRKTAATLRVSEYRPGDVFRIADPDHAQAGQSGTLEFELNGAARRQVADAADEEFLQARMGSLPVITACSTYYAAIARAFSAICIGEWLGEMMDHAQMAALLIQHPDYIRLMDQWEGDRDDLPGYDRDFKEYAAAVDAQQTIY